MTFTKIFYKNEDQRWFIDLPEWIDEGNLLEDLEMVSGADDMLDKLSDFGNRIKITFSDEPFEGGKERVYLNKIDSDEFGADYLAEGKDPVWICKVIKYLFGNYPENLYIK